MLNLIYLKILHVMKGIRRSRSSGERVRVELPQWPGDRIRSPAQPLGWMKGGVASLRSTHFLEDMGRIRDHNLYLGQFFSSEVQGHCFCVPRIMNLYVNFIIIFIFSNQGCF